MGAQQCAQVVVLEERGSLRGSHPRDREILNPLLEADAPRGGAHEEPMSQLKWLWVKSLYFPQHSSVREAGIKIHQLGPRPPEALLVGCALTRVTVPWPFASVMTGLKKAMPKPLLEADAPRG